jgi:queuosine precursor transporter
LNIGCKYKFSILFFLTFSLVSLILNSRPTKLFLAMACFFVANALIAESIGTKIFALEATLGLPTHPFSLFGEKDLTFALTCGVLLWPLEFIMTDLVNDYFGIKAVRRISIIAICLIAYAFIMFYLAMGTSPADWWIASGVKNGIPDMQKAFEGIFGQGMWIIVGSIIAFGVSQILDAYIFKKIKQKTGDKHLWLRATGSTIVSQFIDSFIVLYIAFKIGSDWSWQKVFAISCVNYSYKFIAALALTPILQLVHNAIDKYLGKDIASQMKLEAMM